MWSMLRDRAFLGLKFRRQRPFGTYLLDFFCEELNLAIELDGFGHFNEVVSMRDNERTRFLQSRGVTVIRIENEELIVEPQVVYARLERVVERLRVLHEQRRS